MKKIIVSIIAFSLFSASCSDFIEKDQRGTQTLENYFQTVQECENYANELTQRLLLAKEWWTLTAPRVTNEMSTDDAWMGNTGQDNSAHRPCSQYIITPDNMGDMNSIYTAHFYTIQSANVGLERMAVSPLTDAQKNQYMGESLFVRAYCYYELVNLFGGVPVYTKSLGTGDLTLSRNTAAEVYTQIETDLKDAAAKLESAPVARNGRINKWAAYALLARVSLFQEKWAEAKTYSNKVITEGPFQLESDFLNIWNVNNHNGIESILEAQSSSVQDKSLGAALPTLSGARGEDKKNFPSNDAADVLDGWGWCMPTSDLENAYLSENDVIRRRSTITKWGEAAYGDETLNPTHKFSLNDNKSGRICRKYYIPIATRRSLDKKDGHLPLNIPLIRLAEMYLTRAEANYHTGGDALADINIIRARVKLDPKTGISGPTLLRQIYKERRLELAFEGLRLFDIRREKDPTTGRPVIESLMGPNGTFVQYNLSSTDPYETTNLRESQDKGINFNPAKNLLWPIPQLEIDLSGGVIKQNPGY
ncbi:tetratricopeptide (TPR) repeat protein [Flavobacterium nitrogenifigens]|uniref:Tetratricopeptide (TPR) repeat protein n=2 Tax=Flavobacterium TaxID=237 RepID=A0A7W7IW15_9FLAO|nr:MULTISPECIES: RagB/SusD family nutrient uptake outer membrane protein [Flavobacterium]MBB4801626.1 tetratricopeptide (TPR) repeat protein [Flavobacterium nitrogenifigens]MBB6386584.1 tetratricopeptide (TPR) repeat protein [Flavobacterium notoginsengisoli]